MFTLGLCLTAWACWIAAWATAAAAFVVSPTFEQSISHHQHLFARIIRQQKGMYFVWSSGPGSAHSRRSSRTTDQRLSHSTGQCWGRRSTGWMWWLCCQAAGNRSLPECSPMSDLLHWSMSASWSPFCKQCTVSNIISNRVTPHSCTGLVELGYEVYFKWNRHKLLKWCILTTILVVNLRRPLKRTLVRRWTRTMSSKQFI